MLAELKHFGKAAKKLYITQSTLSRRIQNIESTIDCQLLTRSTREVELTHAGEVLVTSWEEGLSKINEGIEKVKTLSIGPHGDLTLGFCSYATLSVLTNLGGSVYEHYPHVRVKPFISDNESLVTMLHNGELEFAILESRYLEDSFSVIPVQTLAMKAVVPINHPLSHLESMSISHLNNLTLATSNQMFWVKQWREIYKVLDQAGITINTIQIRSTNYDIMKMCVEKNMPALIAVDEQAIPLQGLKIIPITGLNLPLNMNLAWKRNSQNELINSMAEVFRKTNFDELVEGHFNIKK